MIITDLPRSTDLTVFITLKINDNYPGDRLKNCAEITIDDGDDIDSTPGETFAEPEDDEDCVFINVDQTYDLALTKTVMSSDSFLPGDQVTYDIMVINQGTIDAHNIEVTDHIPYGATYVGGDWTIIGNDAKKTITNIPRASSFSMTITLQINANYQGNTLQNCAEITIDDGDDIDSVPGENNNPYEDDWDCDILINATPVYDLSMAMALTGNEPYQSGQQLTYNIIVFNNGNIAAHNIEITNYISPLLTYVSGDWTINENEATQIIEDIPGGENDTLTIVFEINSNQTTIIRNEAEITADDGDDIDSDPNFSFDIDEDGDGNPLDDDEARIDIMNTEVIPIYDLSLENTLLTEGPFFGDEHLTYRITVYNEGNVEAHDIEITDIIPYYMEYIGENWALNGSKATKMIDTLSAGDTLDLNITLRFKPGFSILTIENIAEITADDGDDIDSDPSTGLSVDEDGDGNGDDDDEDKESVTRDPLFDLALRKTLVNGGNLIQGGDVTFSIEVHNQGELDATNVVIIDYIPDYLILNDNLWDFSGTLATHTIEFLGSGDTEYLTISFDIADFNQPMHIVNTCEISSFENSMNLADVDSTPDQNPDNDLLVDNEISDNDNDEDDHDIEAIDIIIENDNLFDITACQVDVFPNPTKDFFSLKIDKNDDYDRQFTLFDTQGNILLSKKFFSDKKDIFIGNLPAGLYFYQLKDEIRILKVGRIIKY